MYKFNRGRYWVEEQIVTGWKRKGTVEEEVVNFISQNRQFIKGTVHEVAVRKQKGTKDEPKCDKFHIQSFIKRYHTTIEPHLLRWQIKVNASDRKQVTEKEQSTTKIITRKTDRITETIKKSITSSSKVNINQTKRTSR